MGRPGDGQRVHIILGLEDMRLDKGVFAPRSRDNAIVTAVASPMTV